MGSNRTQRSVGPRATPGRGGGQVSERVYRRRRLIAVIVLALVAVLVLWGASAAVRAVTGAGEDPQSADHPVVTPVPSVDPEDKFAGFTPRPTPSASGGKDEQSPSPTTAEQCGEHLGVEASTDRESYPAEQEPVLILTLENTGKTPCEVAAGTDRMAYVVTSGSDTVFDSRHCAAPGEEHRITLKPGQTENARLTWDRTRTAEGCPAGQDPAAAGYYHLTVSLGNRQSSPASFVLQ